MSAKKGVEGSQKATFLIFGIIIVCGLCFACILIFIPCISSRLSATQIPLSDIDLSPYLVNPDEDFTSDVVPSINRNVFSTGITSDGFPYNSQILAYFSMLNSVAEKLPTPVKSSYTEVVSVFDRIGIYHGINLPKYVVGFSYIGLYESVDDAKNAFAEVKFHDSWSTSPVDKSWDEATSYFSTEEECGIYLVRKCSVIAFFTLCWDNDGAALDRIESIARFDLIDKLDSSLCR